MKNVHRSVHVAYISPTELGWILKDGRYWMNLFASEQMPDYFESATDDSTDDADSNKDIYYSASDSDEL